ncbi:MAG: PEP-CTERM sorting domain-containing protein [Gloeocapsa sp. DLM2.Bin57]|nr:MAG: PEP-CTERM sorting domain-containing protein [Gloeocapsa sp. DLM2.Bin57]
MLSNQTLVFNKLVGITATVATVGLTLATVSPAQAQTLTLSVNGSIESGNLLGTTYTGTFSFDEPVGSMGEVFVPVDSLSITFTDTEVPPNTATFTEADMPSGPEVLYLDGDLLGLSFSVEDAQLGTVTFDFTFNPGFTEVGQASLFYNIQGGGSGTGTAEFEVVPEPTTMLASFGILGVLGWYRRRSKKPSR